MNTISKLSAVIAILVALTGNSLSQDFLVNLDWKSQYVSTDSSGVFHPEPVIQAGVKATFENGIYIGTYYSTSPESSWGKDLGDELDLNIGWSGDIGCGFKMNASLLYLYEPVSWFPDITYPKITISHEILGWDAGIQIGLYIPMDGSDGGWLAGPVVSKTFNITDHLSVPITVKVLYDSGKFGGDNGVIPSIQTGLNYSVNENLTLRLSIAGCIPVGIDDARESQLVIGVGASITF